MRLTKEELEQVKQRYGVDELWSYSKFSTWLTSRYEWFLSYVKHVQPAAEVTSAYGHIGTIAHDILEKLYDGDIDYNDMAEEFEDQFLTNIELLDLKFDRTDEIKNTSIREKYFENVMDFFKNYKKLPFDMKNEQFLTVEVAPKIVFQGYCDAYYIDNNDNYVIVDYKTSSLYQGKAIEEHSYQLVLYSEALKQMGVPQEKIKCCWNFLKYVSVTYQQVNGKWANSIVERRDIGKKLSARVKTWLKKLGYGEDLEMYLSEMAKNNSIDCLPEDVKEKFHIEDCYVYIEDIWGIYDKLKNLIIETIADINDRVSEYEITGDERLFWDSYEQCKKESYYFNNLCDYSISQLKPYSEWLESLQQEKESNIFKVNKIKKAEEDDDDLSWLDEIVGE